MTFIIIKLEKFQLSFVVFWTSSENKMQGGKYKNDKTFINDETCILELHFDVVHIRYFLKSKKSDG